MSELLNNNNNNNNNIKKMQQLNSNSPLMYIVVIGFHHKKGCQVEFVYPCDNHIIKLPESDNDLYRLPKNWRHLPSLALPDGSHNYDSDYIYFHLEDESITDVVGESPKKSKPNKTIFGISCYRQINASELINKDSEVTRNTLQKSVCILARQPIYSNLKLKLISITNAYFDQKDFYKTDILVQSFNSLTHSYDYSSSLFNDLSLTKNQKTSNYLIGLSLGDLVLRYQHKIVVLFKLILLQKKCLFQLKPVSNLSNTIMSLVSLIPDIFLDDKTAGLSYCSGFFDSIDLVNCELERKNSPTSSPKSNSTETSTLFTQQDSLANNQTQTVKHKRKKSKKRKGLSFSSRKTSHNGLQAPTPAGNISLNLSNSQSSNSVDRKSIESSEQKINSNTNPTTTTTSNNNNQNNTSSSKSSFFNTFTNNTQRFFSFKNKQQSNNQNDDSMIDENTTNVNNSFNKSKLDIKISGSSSSINEASKQQPVESNENNFGTIIKSRMSGVFKLVDWSTNEETTSTPISKSKKKSSIPQIEQPLTNYDIDIGELLQVDFGMPFNLFNEFNILHPYLSLYYLEYFSAINKMNTKLYCTTALMMSMMKDNNNKVEETNDQETSSPVNAEPGSGIGSVTSPIQPQQPTQFGYTIGATNILFKQRLYDDLDAFVDEIDIDFKNNEQLKKQLQLTTADLRFADYIIKNVNSYAKASSNNSNSSTPTLLSFKKTTSLNNFDRSNINNNNISSSEDSSPPLNQSANWEGSDDWIRLNFKWYLYSMFGSIIKEDLYTLIKNELDHIYFSTNNNSNSNSDSNTNYSSSSGSQASLANEVIDIDDYIDRVNNNNNNDEQLSINNRKSLNVNSERKSSSTSSTSTLSSSKYYLLQSNSQSDYRDDFNSNYINELKKTNFFKQWYDLNKLRLEKTLLKFDAQSLEIQLQQLNSTSPNDLTSLNNKFNLLINQLQDLDKIKLNHPFSGQISVNDIKLRLNVLFTGTESGRKINKALMEGGKLVNNTGKAVGDALSQAKSTFNSFLSNWSANNSPMPAGNNNQSVLANKSSKTINLNEDQLFRSDN